MSAVTGVGASHLCLIEKGERIPGTIAAVRIKRVTGIPVEAWVP